MKNKNGWIRVFIVLVVSGLLLNGCNYEDDPVSTINSNTNSNLQVSTYDLIAGQNITVGEVRVWNDQTNLYVDYVIDEPGWCLTETHMHAATILGGIPQTKKGNPIPGQFAYKHEDLNCTLIDHYIIPLTNINPDWQCDDDLLVATHAVVQNQNEECIDFEAYTEKQGVNTVSTSAGDVKFYMTQSTPLFGLNIGEAGTFTPPVNQADLYPIVATPETTPPLEDIVAFTVQGNYTLDDKVLNDNGTGAGGNTLTDPQDLSQVPLQQHAISKFLAIVVDVSNIDDLQELNLVSIDMDHNEEWHFQYFNDANILIYEAVLNEGNVGYGDGKAFPVDYSNPDISKVAIWGGNNLNIADRIGYAIDNVCITSAESETAWGNGTQFPGNNWGMYFSYTITCDDPPPPPPTGCDNETAFGGNTAGDGSAWWYYFDTQGPATQNIYAGQQLMDGGSVTFSGGNLIITLGTDWSLQNVSEPVKVEGYAEGQLPSSRPPAGQFTLYKGTSLTVPGDGSRYYIIHLDVLDCRP